MGSVLKQFGGISGPRDDGCLLELLLRPSYEIIKRREASCHKTVWRKNNVRLSYQQAWKRINLANQKIRNRTPSENPTCGKLSFLPRAQNQTKICRIIQAELLLNTLGFEVDEVSSSDQDKGLCRKPKFALTSGPGSVVLFGQIAMQGYTCA